MGIPPTLCRHEEGRKQLWQSQTTRYPRWAEGVKLTSALQDNKVIFATLTEEATKKDRFAKSQHQWCLFFGQCLVDHFGWDLPTSERSGTVQSPNLQKTARVGSTESTGLTSILSETQVASSGKTIDKSNVAATAASSFKLWYTIELMIFAYNHKGSLFDSHSNAQQLMEPILQRFEFETSEIRTLLKNAYHVLILDLLYAVDDICRRNTSTRDEARQELNKFSLSMRNKDMRAKVTPAQRKANKELKQAEAKLDTLLRQQIAVRDSMLRHVGNVVIARPNYGLDKILATYKSYPPSDNSVLLRNHPLKDRSHYLQMSHHILLEMIGGINTHGARQIAGERSYFLCGPAVFLSQALVNYSLSYLDDHNCQIVQTPEIMTAEMMARVSQLDDFDDNLYSVSRNRISLVDSCRDAASLNSPGSNYLIATAEQPLCAMHFKSNFCQEDLPMDYGGLSTCFRTEAGSSGKDMKGIFRVHQFEKVEQVTIAAPSQSEAAFARLLSRTMSFYDSLGLPYQIIRCPAAELTRSAAIKYDIEAWFPDQGQYREVVSCSNCTDFQARALRMRMKKNKKTVPPANLPRGGAVKKVSKASSRISPAGDTTESNRHDKSGDIPHLLNSTLMANTRTICAILENNAVSDGIIVPDKLRPFMPPKYRYKLPYTQRPKQGEWEQSPDGYWSMKGQEGGSSSTSHIKVPCSHFEGAFSDESMHQSNNNESMLCDRYPLLITCLHPKGVQFRKSARSDDIYLGGNLRGIRSGYSVPARQVGKWFATARIPRLLSEGNNVHDKSTELRRFMALGAGQEELWLPAASSEGINWFETVSWQQNHSNNLAGRCDVVKHPDRKLEPKPRGFEAQADSMLHDAPDLHDRFEADPDDLKSSRDVESADNPDSWGMGVLYEERRMDGGEAFTKEEFLEFYGGFEEWERAIPKRQ